jgi:hypothetical protein
MRRAFLVVAPVIGAALIACQLLIGIDDRKVPDTMMMPGDADPCTAIGYPLRPDPSTSGNNDAIDVFFALYAVNTGTDAGNVVRPWGFNLDQRCTCPGTNSCAAAKPFCDREAGIDDEGQFVFTELQKLAAAFDAAAFFSDQLFNTALQSGVSGLLLRVRGYNGKENDANVQVAIYSSPGYSQDAAPAWNGNDTWNVDQQYVGGLNIDNPNYEVTGWVSGYTLVASPSQIPIVIGNSFGQPVRLRLDNGYIVAKLEMTNGMPTAMTGALAGRWKAVDFLQGLEVVPDPTNMSVKLCGTSGSLVYSAVANTVCAHRDLNADKGLDNSNAPCDAVSFGIGFEARAARAGNVTMAPTGTPGCTSWKAMCSN